MTSTWIPAHQYNNKQGAVPENDKTKKPDYNKNTTVLDAYLKEHSKSIEAYHALQKQQEEVLHLCKEKIAQRFPSSDKAAVKDEHIIKALRIAENSNCEFDTKNGDRLTRAVLDVIMSNNNQNVNAKPCTDCNDPKTNSKAKKFRPDVCLSDYVNSKRKTVFNKFVNMFTKPTAQRTFFTSSDNYFNNTNAVTSSQMGLVRYPAIVEDTNYSSGDDRKGKIKELLGKFNGDTSHLSKNPEGDSSINSSDVTTNAERNKKRNNYFTYYCAYQRDVDFLKSEIKRQKLEIKSIQKNLNQCLHILRTFEERKERKKGYRSGTETYRAITPNDFTAFHPSAQPYCRYYQHYKAETEPHCDTNSSTAGKASTNTSSNAEKRKCCCFKKKSQKKRKNKKRKREPEVHCTCTHLCQCPNPSNLKLPPGSNLQSPHSSFNCGCKRSRTEYGDHVDFPETVVKVDNAQDAEDLETPSSHDSESTESCKGKKKKKKSRKKRKKKEPRKRKKKQHEQHMADGKPRKRSCCIRFLKVLCCGSPCI